MPLSSTNAVSSPLFTIHLEDETSGNGCRKRRKRMWWTGSGDKSNQTIFWCWCHQEFLNRNLCVHVWTAGYADWEYVRETSVNTKCANSYFPHYLDTLASAKPCVHYACRSHQVSDGGVSPYVWGLYMTAWAHVLLLNKYTSTQDATVWCIT